MDTKAYAKQFHSGNSQRSAPGGDKPTTVAPTTPPKQAFVAPTPSTCPTCQHKRKVKARSQARYRSRLAVKQPAKPLG